MQIQWDAESAEKGGYAHFMLKEIHEQPQAVRDTIQSYLNEQGEIDFPPPAGRRLLKQLERIYFVACGSAYHVGAAAKYVIEAMTDLPVEIDLASEFRYRDPKLVKNSLVVVVSQSGETRRQPGRPAPCQGQGRAGAGHRQRGGLQHRA